MPKKLSFLFARHEGRCYYCERQMTLAPHKRNSVTRDHRIPKAHGGGGYRNVVAACFRCNSLKGEMTEGEFRAQWPDPSKLPRGPLPYKRKIMKAQQRREAWQAKRKAILDGPGGWSRPKRPGFDPAEMGLSAQPMVAMSDVWPEGDR
ncbi:MAG: HNH endonuclease [Alphaproteobacteria bacterium]